MGSYSLTLSLFLLRFVFALIAYFLLIFVVIVCFYFFIVIEKKLLESFLVFEIFCNCD
jgi:hypothetical protein